MTTTKQPPKTNNLHPEIRITLKSILNMTNLAASAPNPADHLLYIRKIQRTAASLLRTLDNVEGITDTPMLDMKLEKASFDLEQVLEDLRDQVGEQIESKGLEFVFKIGPAVPTRLIGDPLRLGQILLNLVSNAIKFTERGEIVVDVTMLEKKERSAALEFHVRDTGIGLTEEQQAALFEDARDSFTVTQHHLIGLGVVKSLVEKMGGSVFVRSQVDHGSTFGFTAVLDTPDDDSPVTVSPSPVLAGMNILVVDDNATMRKTLQVMLESLSFRVTAVSSGADAMTAIEEKDGSDPFEIVFMDWMMPGMDGLETARTIRQHPGLSWKPLIIMVTAYGRTDLRLAARRVGIEGFLLKPVSVSTLQNTIMSLFSLS